MKEVAEIKSKKWKKMIVICVALITVIILIIIAKTFSHIMPESTIDTVKQIETINEVEINAEVNENKVLNLLDYNDIKDSTYITTESMIDSALPEIIDDNSLALKGNLNSIGTETKKDIEIIDAENKDNELNSKFTTIDESTTTMKDETIKNEYQLENIQQPIDFFEVEAENKAPNGDVPAGGKQDVGTWN